MPFINVITWSYFVFVHSSNRILQWPCGVVQIRYQCLICTYVQFTVVKLKRWQSRSGNGARFGTCNTLHKKWDNIILDFKLSPCFESCVCILLGISPASDCGLQTFRNPLSVPSSRAGCKVWSMGISPASDCGLPTFRNPPSVPSSRAGCKVWSSVVVLSYSGL